MKTILLIVILAVSVLGLGMLWNNSQEEKLQKIHSAELVTLLNGIAKDLKPPFDGAFTKYYDGAALHDIADLDRWLYKAGRKHPAAEAVRMLRSSIDFSRTEVHNSFHGEHNSPVMTREERSRDTVETVQKEILQVKEIALNL